jgi:hypothetical protein
LKVARNRSSLQIGIFQQLPEAVRDAVALFNQRLAVPDEIAQIPMFLVGGSVTFSIRERGICPGNAESEGRRLSSKNHKGNVRLRQVLIEIAHFAYKTKGTPLASRISADRR